MYKEYFVGQGKKDGQVLRVKEQRKDRWKAYVHDTISGIAELDYTAMEEMAQHLDQLTKPPGSLGRLEKIAVQLAGITGSIKLQKQRKAVVVMAGDHGVCAEGVSAYPQEVTAQMVLNILDGGAAVNVLARQAGGFCVLRRRRGEGRSETSSGSCPAMCGGERAIWRGKRR